MNTSLDVAKHEVKDWLIGEHAYQFDKNLVTHNSDPLKSVSYILDTELENKWHRFQHFYSLTQDFPEPRMFAQANQQLLKTCGAARGAFIWEQISLGESVQSASEISFRGLDLYFNTVKSPIDLPNSALLLGSLAHALEVSTEESSQNSSTKSKFIRLAGLSATYLIKQTEVTGHMFVPRPGVQSGEIIL